MRGVSPRSYLPWLVLLALLAGGVALWQMFVGQQQFILRTGFQNQLEHVADELFRARLEGELDQLPEGVRAFAVYDPRGRRQEAWGIGSPELIDPEVSLFSPLIEPGSGPNTVALVKSLQPLGPRMRSLMGPPPMDSPGAQGPGSGPRPRGPQGPPGPHGFLFVSVEASPLVMRQRMWMMGGLLGTVVWGGIIVLVGVLWFRTRRYQTALAQHRELLQFAQASRTLGHEIQNPLASILLQTALLKRGGSAGPEVTVIEEEAQRISGLVTRVRDFLKDPQGQPEILDLAALLATLSGRLSAPVTVETETAAPFPVRFDAYRLRSVVENLLKNAVEADGNSQPTARLSRPRSGWIRIEVLDSGQGFTDEALKRALDPFFTTKTSGSGIGLSIADGFIRAAGGRLKLENRREGGARVIVELPEAKEPA
jgi:two-component system sensor histidine kinase HydH